MKRQWVILVAIVTLAAFCWVGAALGEATPSCGPECPTVPPADTYWSSGWFDIAAGEGMNLTHNFGGDPAYYAVDLWFNDTRTPGLGLHQRAYGTMEVDAQYYGAYWHNLTENTVRVEREVDDITAGRVRMRIWMPDPPEYASDWVDIAAGGTFSFTHGVGGDVDDYTVGIKFRKPGGAHGIHQYALGGVVDAEYYYGGAWQNLTDSTIQVMRFADDTAMQQVRVSIYRPGPPDYDSGWRDIAREESLSLPHGLGGAPGSYVVRLSARSPGVGVNIRAMGGLEINGHYQGSNWQNLTADSIVVHRRPHDVFAEQVRVRIWAAQCVPTLLTPEEGAVMDNGRTDQKNELIWEFTWEGCPEATAYHLYVIGPTDTAPRIDLDDLQGTQLRYASTGHIPNDDLSGWTWKVRAQVDGEWGEWSETRSFDVEPVDTDPPVEPLYLPVVVKPE